MDIRPQDLPELRADLVEVLQRPDVIESMAAKETKPVVTVIGASNGGDWSGRIPYNPNADERRVSEIERLKAADLYFVAADMVDLAIAASASLPGFDLAEEDIPSAAGLMVFESPIAQVQTTDVGSTVFITAVSWDIYRAQTGGFDWPLLWLSFYADGHCILDGEVEQGRMTAEQAATYKRLGARVLIQQEAAKLIGMDTAGRNGVRERWGSIILAAWLLMQQQLAALAEVEPDRAARKRLRREGHESAAVRVIELRRPKHSGGEPGESGRTYAHRWITRGHWRQQWYPSREVHRPVWIAPHVKGPEGAPMIGGEKVYAWKR